MPPEQARGEPADERSDVYALGALLYHLLAGEPPYGRGVGDVLAGPPPPLERRVPALPADLGAIVAKAMARAPERRYPTAVALAEDLRRYQTGRLVSAHRYSRRALARRWLRRRATLLAALVALGAGAAALLLWRRGAAPVRASCPRAETLLAGAW